MLQQIEILALPFLACLVLTGIHAYLGIHVLSRKVIFVDIALAQIAALGATVAFLLGFDPQSEGSYWFSLTFAVLAAVIFALTRTRVERVPQEAVIGLTYAIAAATAILLADLSPHGAEHLKNLLAGSIVWVTPGQVIKTALLYTAIGLFHYVFRRRFLLISMDPGEAYRQGLNVRLWDFLFYLSFGVVITSSVQIAGVLLVFCYLVAPAVFAVMFADTLRLRLALGWSIGTLVSAAGLFFSYDKPSGPMIMVIFAVVLVVGGVLRVVLGSARPLFTGAIATAGVVLTMIIGYGALSLVFPALEDDHLHGGDSTHAREAAREAAEEHDLGSTLADIRLGLADSHPAVRARAAAELALRQDRQSAGAIAALLDDPSTAVRESAAKALGAFDQPEVIGPLATLMNNPDEDEWVRLYAATSVVVLGEASGVRVLFLLAGTAEASLIRHIALETLAGVTQRQTDHLEELESWWNDHGSEMVWDPETKSYQAGPDRK